MVGTAEPHDAELLSLSSPSEVHRLRERISKLESLLDVAKAMTEEHNLESLLSLIVSEATRVVGADRCSLWIMDHRRRELWSKVAPGIADHDRIRVPVGVGIVGQVALTGATINISDAYADPRFNRRMDVATGYRTRNILGVAMRYKTGQVTGVLQALNKKNDDHFTHEDEELLIALGANAAAAIENAILYEEIDRLFEGFVRASVTAIESRDPATSGHSERVAVLTLGIAENVNRLTAGPYGNTFFDEEGMREMRYAALLHDFGKVGVREHILTKEKKLFASEMAVIEARLRTRTAQQENAHLRAMLAAAQAGMPFPVDAEEALENERAHLREFLSFVQRCNEPTVLESEGFERLRDITDISYVDDLGNEVPVLRPRDLERLSIPKGSLDPAERREVESHVTHTFRFLTQIPWTRNLSRVPHIAYAHHEKLDGSGYPLRLAGAQVPPQARMMAIADIYDALTAQDRPYKPALPHAQALDILTADARAGKLDADLVSVFIDAKVHETVQRSLT